MSSDYKIKEARFFLELLNALDKQKNPLTHSGDCALEASYLFSAILNSFYSAIVIMRDEENINVSNFINTYPEIYARANKGGERAKTVHVYHTLPAKSGYIPPIGEVNFDLRKTPLLVEEAKIPGRVDLNLGSNHYMLIGVTGKLEDVNDFCHKHFYKLLEFYATAKAKP